MYLLIDLLERDFISLTLFDDNKVLTCQNNGRNRELLESIDSFFGKESFNKKDLLGIAVVIGEGSFTSTRIGTTVANTFGYIYNIPLITITKDRSLNTQTLIPMIQKQPKGQYISATYSAEPSIGPA
jgi:tRNA A37 threonylcarbamoyladenosine modification protein TsaB